uniref:Uncharacterized protein n=1 Tax=Rhizophagus irregularis (strain DAOM 181602 / DAOM 197198 / MUCL 43194) TaxID=747089 RepID=U9U3P0_RHIID
MIHRYTFYITSSTGFHKIRRKPITKMTNPFNLLGFDLIVLTRSSSTPELK